MCMIPKFTVFDAKVLCVKGNVLLLLKEWTFPVLLPPTTILV